MIGKFISFLAVVLVVSACVDHPTPDLEDYPVSFPNLESDILFNQDLTLCLYDKETEAIQVLEGLVPQHASTNIQWTYDGVSILYIDPYNSSGNGTISDTSMIFRYNFSSEEIEPISDFFCSEFWLSPYENSLLYELHDEIYFFNLDEGVSHSLNNLLYESVESDPSLLSFDRYSGVRWDINDNLEFSSYLKIELTDSTSRSQKFYSIIDYTSNPPILIDTLNWQYPRVTYNSDRSMGVFIINNASDPKNGTWLIHRSNNDTIQVADRPAFTLIFSPDDKYLAYSYYTVYTEMFDASTKMWIYNTETGENYDPFPEAYEVGGLSFSGTSNQIVCHADFWADDYSDNIWVMNVDGTNPTIISDPSVSNTKPVFRP